jgi:hypothetical protein
VRHFRKRDPTGQHPSIRAAIMIARVLACQGLSFDPANPIVLNVCRDVLHVGSACGRAKNLASFEELRSALAAVCAPPREHLPHCRPVTALPIVAEGAFT